MDYLIYYGWSIVKVLVRYVVIQLKISVVAISRTTHAVLMIMMARSIYQK